MQDNDSYESYRYELWKNIIDNNYNFDFIGREKDYGTYPLYAGLEFDNGHEGSGGFESDDVHYNPDGAKFIADIYFAGIQSEFSSTNLSDIKILPLGDSRVEGSRP